MKDLIKEEMITEEKMKNDRDNTIPDNSAIDLSLRVDSEEEALELVKITKPGQYISVTNKNNLAQVFIYKRNLIDTGVTPDGIWDGKESDISWYDDKEQILHIRTAAQLRGLCDLVDAGFTFKGKEVQLDINIDLNYYEWKPIGKPYMVNEEMPDNLLYMKYSIQTDSSHTFQGVFNGKGHYIHNLAISKNAEDTTFSGFFLAIDQASVHNITFENVRLISEDDNTSFAAVAGIANNSIFTNVTVSGIVNCTKPSGICGIARDTAFYGCRNKANLNAKTSSKAGIVAGGLCQQITLSKDMTIQLQNKAPRLFMNCINEGSIVADGTNAKYLWIGNFFGGTYYEKGVQSFSFIMDRCNIECGTNIIVENADTVEGETVFFGYRDGFQNGAQNNVGITSKDDLMNGLIGRVDQYVGIEVKKLTSSSVVNNLVIPGSINTMISGVGDNTFHTLNVTKATLEESIYDLEPYFQFVRTAKK